MRMGSFLQDEAQSNRKEKSLNLNPSNLASTEPKYIHKSPKIIFLLIKTYFGLLKPIFLICVKTKT